MARMVPQFPQFAALFYVSFLHPVPGIILVSIRMLSKPNSRKANLVKGDVRMTAEIFVRLPALPLTRMLRSRLPARKLPFGDFLVHPTIVHAHAD